MPRLAKGELDPRHAPIVVFMYEEWQEHRGLRLVIDGSDILALKRMLSSTKDLVEFDLEHLKWMFLAFLNSPDRFDAQQGKPIRYFSANINKFAVQLSGSATKKQSAGTNAAKDWMRKRLADGKP